jgi:Flp pilus assembly pilin Flp
MEETMRTIDKKRKRGESGNTLVEFALCLTFLAPLMLGLFSIGMNLTRNMQVTQVSRSTGLMYVRQLDFSVLQNQRMIVRLTEGLGMKLNDNYDPDPNGRGVVIVSQVTIPSDSDCTGAGLIGGACTNRGVPVIIHRFRFGNTALRTSDFGQPPREPDCRRRVSRGERLPDEYCTAGHQFRQCDDAYLLGNRFCHGNIFQLSRL